MTTNPKDINYVHHKQDGATSYAARDVMDVF